MTTKVAMLTTDLAYGGAEVQLVELALRLKRRGWSVGVISALPPAAFEDPLRNAGIPVESLNMRRGIPNPRAVVRLVRVLRGWRPDVLHSHMVHANLLGRVARLGHWVPVLISTSHAIHEGGRWREFAYRATDALCDVTTSVCEAGVQRYIDRRVVPAHKMLLVPNGVDVERFAPRSSLRKATHQALGLEREFAWICVGRLEHVKDHRGLLDAFARVRLSRSVLLLAGLGSLESSLRERTVALGIQDRVRFLGLRRDVCELLNAADGLVLCSAGEGLSMVLLEASAVGLPMVATDVGGNSEVVRHGESGYLVPAGNPGALAAAMDRLVALPDPERALMARRARAYVCHNFAIERVVDRWEQLYRRLAVAKGRLIGRDERQL